MPTEVQAELTIVFSEDLGTQTSSRFIERIKLYSRERFQRAVFNTNRLFVTLAAKEEISLFIASLVKNLSELAREYRIGIRDYYLPYYEIAFDSDYIGKVKIPFTEAIICNGKTCKVIMKDIEKDFLRAGSVGRIIKLIESKTKERTWKIVHKNELHISPEGQKNPYEEIEMEKLVKKGLAKNEFFYLPKGIREISRIKKALLEELDKKFHLEEFFPLSHVSFSIIENHDVSELVPPEAFQNSFCELESTQETYESYVITGSIKSLKARNKGIVFDEIPFNLYKALEKRKVVSPHYLYCQKNMKLLITFFETGEKYPEASKTISEEVKKLLEKMKISYRILSRSVNGEILRYEGYLPYNKTWIPLAEILLSGDAYTKPFKITGKSGQVNISLENILLAEIAQGIIRIEKAGSMPEEPTKRILPEKPTHTSAHQQD